MYFSENYLSGLLLYRSGHHQTTDLNHLLKNPTPTPFGIHLSQFVRHLDLLIVWLSQNHG